MGRHFTRTCRLTKTGDGLAVVAPDWLAGVSGKLIISNILLESGTTPATTTAAIYIEDRVTEGRQSTDNVYDATAVPTLPVVAQATGLSLVKGGVTAGPYPAQPVPFRGGVAVKINMSNTGAGAWQATVDLGVELDVP